MNNTRKAVDLGRVSLLLVIDWWLAACSEPPPAGVITQENLNNTSTGVKSNLYSRTVRIEGAWNSPEVIGTEAVDGSPQNFLLGPNFKMDQLGVCSRLLLPSHY